MCIVVLNYTFSVGKICVLWINNWARPGRKPIIVNFFSSVAHVWVPGAKTTGSIVKVWFFLNLI
jgi:hypothetical protein